MKQRHVTPRTVALSLAGAGLLFIIVGAGQSDQLVAVGLVFSALAALFDGLWGGQKRPPAAGGRRAGGPAREALAMMTVERAESNGGNV